MTSENDERKAGTGPQEIPTAAPASEAPAFEGFGPLLPDQAEAAAAGPEGPDGLEPELSPKKRSGRGRDRSAADPPPPEEQALADARRENSELKDRYLRLAAEMENLRKRLEREKTEYYQFALADLFKELLSVLDNFERALLSAPGSDPAGFQEGIGLIHKQMTDLLRKRGVTPIETADAAFDPTIQQAIVTEASAEVEEPRVAEELQRGYRLHDRLLRPALVKVLMPGKD